RPGAGERARLPAGETAGGGRDREPCAGEVRAQGGSIGRVRGGELQRRQPRKRGGAGGRGRPPDTQAARLTRARRRPHRDNAAAGRQGADPTPLDVASRLLARSGLTEAALQDRLVAKGYQPSTAARTVARCRELGYVSDERLALDRARTLRARGAGSLKIAADLAAPALSANLAS